MHLLGVRGRGGVQGVVALAPGAGWNMLSYCFIVFLLFHLLADELALGLADDDA